MGICVDENIKKTVSQEYYKISRMEKTALCIIRAEEV